MERTIILYHGSCPDGFGGAYSAWKKFGDTAQYVGLSRGEEPPVEACRGAKLYFVDFSYPKEIMDQFITVASSVTVLDHHEGIKDVIEAMPEFVYDANRSGATIAWNYFHPDIEVPSLLRFVEDADLFRFVLPDSRAFTTFIDIQPFEFPLWDDIAQKLDHPDQKEGMLTRARVYAEYFELLANLSVDHAKLISFEGYTCYFASAHPLKAMKSLVGNILARKQPPLSLVVSAHPNGYGVSIRGDGTVDVAKIAQKFGGNGHPNSAGFLIPREGPFPWTLIENEDSSH